MQTWIETRLTTDTVTAIKAHLVGQLEYDDEIESTTVKGNGTDETKRWFCCKFSLVLILFCVKLHCINL